MIAISKPREYSQETSGGFGNFWKRDCNISGSKRIKPSIMAKGLL